MPRLRDGTVLTSWKHSIAAIHPQIAAVTLSADLLGDVEATALGESPSPSLVEALGEHVIEGEPTTQDGWMEGRLSELDQRYTGWVPGFWSGAESTIVRVEKMHARRRLFALPRAARPTLPASTARRAQILAALGAETTYLEDDPDGLAVLLAQRSRVTVCEANAFRRAWLWREAETAGVAEHLEIIPEPPRSEFALSVIHAGPPATTAAALARAIGVTPVGGYIAACVRTPWEEVLTAQIEASGLSVRAYQREIDHWLLPGGLVVEGAGDLAVLERSVDARAPRFDDSDTERYRARPYFNVDLDDLSPDRLDPKATERFADALAARAPRPQAMRSLQRHDGRDVLAWYDESGIGLTAELRPAERHLMITLMPYDTDLEYVVMSTAYELFADRFARARPIRTRSWQREGIFG